MFELIVSNQFKKDAKRYRHNKSAQQAVRTVLDLLVRGEPLPPQYREHALIGNYVGYLECHSKPDLLLIYRRDATDQTILLYRLGSHADVFG